MITEFIPKKQYMQECLRLANLALEQGEVPVGAVVEINGTIVGYGFNRKEELQDPTAHAELLAIKMACQTVGSWRLSGANLYVSMEPCPMCTGTAINARINRIIFGAHDDVSGCLGSAINLSSINCNHKILVYRGFMECECSQIIMKFFKQIRKNK